MRTYARVLCCLAFSSAVVYGHNSQHLQAIQSILSRYKRPFTLVEIGRESWYLTALPHQPRMVGVLIAVQQDEGTVVQDIIPLYPSSVSIMVPPRLTYEMLETLSRCEHFDVVIVHDLSSYIDIPLNKLSGILTSLGDHVFMVAQSPSAQESLHGYQCLVEGSSEEPSLYLSQRSKKGLDLARYTQRKPRASVPRYSVVSTYTYKEFQKADLDYPVPWIHGINLVTFCMLYGIYPDDEELRRQLVRCRVNCHDHTDLVIGNFILQGCQLFPIDSNDRRRNADPYAFINDLLRAFKRGNARLADPQGWIDAYYTQLVGPSSR